MEGFKVHVQIIENEWYRWLGSNQRPPDPQSGALTI
jgi:hypothetical protein